VTAKVAKSIINRELIQHEIINLPSVTAIATQRQALKGRKHAPKTLAILANPVFDSSDTRLTNKNMLKIQVVYITNFYVIFIKLNQRETGVYSNSQMTVLRSNS
jgi:hypothetical protein